MCRQMRRARTAAAAALGALLWLRCGGPAAAAACDEYDPDGPSRSARITLGAGDLMQAGGEEMRSFIATGSVGTVKAEIVSATPPGIVAGFSAAPEISRSSAQDGDGLKGIAVAVQLARGGEAARVVIGLRQVCARYFRETFLYY